MSGMDLFFVNAFVEATLETFETMCDAKPERSAPLKMQGCLVPTFDVFSMIGVSGGFRATYVLTMPRDTALKMTSAFVGEEIEELDEEALDAIGEIINIIAGAAAGKFTGNPLNLSLPTVMLGRDLRQSAGSKSPWLIVTMKEDNWGEFQIGLSRED